MIVSTTGKVVPMIVSTTGKVVPTLEKLFQLCSK
jgi:hypothetical protein